MIAKPARASRRPNWLRLSHEHTAFSAMLLLMVSTLLSRVIGLVRIKVIAFLFGAGWIIDAYTGAFQLPDMLTYLLAGGTASITFHHHPEPLSRARTGARGRRSALRDPERDVAGVGHSSDSG